MGSDTGRQNSRWQGRVISLMRDGLGFDDIAVKMGCPPEQVRLEAQILRDEGRLIEIYNSWRRPV